MIRRRKINDKRMTGMNYFQRRYAYLAPVRQMIVIAITVALVLGASSCSGAIGSAAATHTRSDGASHVLGGGAVLLARAEEVLLLPYVEAGWAGWCMISVSASGGGGCGHVQSHGPIIDETWGSGGPPPVTNGTALTDSQVAAVSFDGSAPIPTRPESGLPDGLRLVVIEIKGKALLEESASLPSFTPLNARGEAIPESAKPDAPLAVEVHSRSVRHAADSTSGACQIHTEHLPGLAAQEGSVVTRITSYSELIGPAFLSCASIKYGLDSWPLLAGMLLDASHPGATPAVLPTMKPVPGHPGDFQAPAQEGWLVARRVPGAWLVVAKGSGLQQRLTLLEHLQATVRL